MAPTPPGSPPPGGRRCSLGSRPSPPANGGRRRSRSGARGNHVSANWGGSTDAVTVQSDHPKEAAEFAIWINHARAPVHALATDLYLFPVLKAELDSPVFKNASVAFYGGPEGQPRLQRRVQDGRCGLPVEPVPGLRLLDPPGAVREGRPGQAELRRRASTRLKASSSSTRRTRGSRSRSERRLGGPGTHEPGRTGRGAAWVGGAGSPAPPCSSETRSSHRSSLRRSSSSSPSSSSRRSLYALYLSLYREQLVGGSVYVGLPRTITTGSQRPAVHRRDQAAGALHAHPGPRDDRSWRSSSP